MDEIKRGDRFVKDGDDTHLYVVLAADMVDMDGDRFVLFEKRHKPHPSHTYDWTGDVEPVWGCTSLDGLVREGFTPYRPADDPESPFEVGGVMRQPTVGGTYWFIEDGQKATVIRAELAVNGPRVSVSYKGRVSTVTSSYDLDQFWDLLTDTCPLKAGDVVTYRDPDDGDDKRVVRYVSTDGTEFVYEDPDLGLSTASVSVYRKVG